MLKVTGLSALLLMGACSSTPWAGVTKEERLLCDIISHPSKYDGVEVRVRGQIVTDYREFSGIRGRACPGKYLRFGRVDSNPEGNDELEASLRQTKGRPDTAVMATVTGHATFWGKQVPSVTLAVRSIDNIIVTSERN